MSVVKIEVEVTGPSRDSNTLQGRKRMGTNYTPITRYKCPLCLIPCENEPELHKHIENRHYVKSSSSNNTGYDQKQGCDIQTNVLQSPKLPGLDLSSLGSSANVIDIEGGLHTRRNHSISHFKSGENEQSKKIGKPVLKCDDFIERYAETQKIQQMKDDSETQQNDQVFNNDHYKLKDLSSNDDEMKRSMYLETIEDESRFFPCPEVAQTLKSFLLRTRRVPARKKRQKGLLTLTADEEKYLYSLNDVAENKLKPNPTKFTSKKVKKNKREEEEHFCDFCNHKFTRRDKTLSHMIVCENRPVLENRETIDKKIYSENVNEHQVISKCDAKIRNVIENNLNHNLTDVAPTYGQVKVEDVESNSISMESKSPSLFISKDNESKMYKTSYSYPEVKIEDTENRVDVDTFVWEIKLEEREPKLELNSVDTLTETVGRSPNGSAKLNSSYGVLQDMYEMTENNSDSGDEKEFLCKVKSEEDVDESKSNCLSSSDRTNECCRSSSSKSVYSELLLEEIKEEFEIVDDDKTF